MDLVIEFTKEEKIQSFKKNSIIATNYMNNGLKENFSGEVKNISDKARLHFIKNNNGDFYCKEDVKQFSKNFLKY